MAFGNYSYNPYVNPYMSAYNAPQAQFGQTMQLPNQQTQMPQTASQPPQNGFVWVDGIEEANLFYVAPNNAVQLWDKNAPTIYKKSADSTGKPSMQIFDLVERKAEDSNYIKTAGNEQIELMHEEIEELKAKVDALMAQKAKPKTKVIVEDEDDG